MPARRRAGRRGFAWVGASACPRGGSRAAGIAGRILPGGGSGGAGSVGAGAGPILAGKGHAGAFPLRLRPGACQPTPGRCDRIARPAVTRSHDGAFSRPPRRRTPRLAGGTARRHRAGGSRAGTGRGSPLSDAGGAAVRRLPGRSGREDHCARDWPHRVTVGFARAAGGRRAGNIGRCRACSGAVVRFRSRGDGGTAAATHGRRRSANYDPASRHPIGRTRVLRARLRGRAAAGWFGAHRCDGRDRATLAGTAGDPDAGRGRRRSRPAAAVRSPAVRHAATGGSWRACHAHRACSGQRRAEPTRHLRRELPSSRARPRLDAPCPGGCGGGRPHCRPIASADPASFGAGFCAGFRALHAAGGR